MNQGISKISYRPDIDGLRAIAILFVVGFHYFPGVFKFGFIGVDIFFVISGYLITKIISEDLQNHKFNLASFYARRIRRIYPNIIALILGSLAIGWVILLPQEILSISWYALSGVTFSTNFLAINDGGYFGQSVYIKPLILVVVSG